MTTRKHSDFSKLKQTKAIQIKDNWIESAECSKKVLRREINPKVFISEDSEEINTAIDCCIECPVLRDCFAFALQVETDATGVYGAVEFDGGKPLREYDNVLTSLYPEVFE